MKNYIKYFLQQLLGFERYLYVFSLFIIKTLPWKKSESDFMKFNQMIKGEGIVLDLGANIGVMTYHLAHSHPRSTILSIEPIPIFISTIKRIITKYQLINVLIIPTAIGDTVGTAQMKIPIIGNAKQQGLSHIAELNASHDSDGEYLICPLTTVDEIIKEYVKDKRIIAIKMDVENYESKVIAGAVTTLTKHKPIIYCELWDNQNRYDTIKQMESLGYIAMVYLHSLLVEYNNASYKGQNFFFIPR